MEGTSKVENDNKLWKRKIFEDVIKVYFSVVLRD
jgi:hypothetical protein